MITPPPPTKAANMLSFFDLSSITKGDNIARVSCVCCQQG